MTTAKQTAREDSRSDILGKKGKGKDIIMKKTVFRGVATALITPFHDGQIDYDAFGRLIDWQIESGINGLVVCGTTGEASTPTQTAVPVRTPL